MEIKINKEYLAEVRNELPHNDKFVDDEHEICTDCVRNLK